MMIVFVRAPSIFLLLFLCCFPCSSCSFASRPLLLPLSNTLAPATLSSSEEAGVWTTMVAAASRLGCRRIKDARLEVIVCS